MGTDICKATVKSSSRIKSIISVGIYTVLALFSTIMAIYDIVTGRHLFGVLFALATLIFVILLLIRGNFAFGTQIKADDTDLVMRSWENDFLPYDVNGGFLSDLKPAKTKVTEIPISEITMVLLGSKDFVKRNATQAGKPLIKALFPYEHSSRKSKQNLLNALDLFYVETADNDCSFMCIDGYDPQEVVRILKKLCRVNPDIFIKVNSRDYRKFLDRTPHKDNTKEDVED